jgi:HK97 family phage portal protein
VPDIFDGIRNTFRRKWTRAPDRTKNGLPALFHTSPRLDPVRVIAKAAASVDGRLYSKKAMRRDAESADAIDDHELYHLLENPCPTFVELDGWALRYITFAHLRLVGEFFWLKVRDTSGRIISLLPVPSAWVPKKPTVGDHTYLIYPYGVTAGTALTVLPEDVVWFKDPDLNDPYSNGRGSTEAVADEVETDEYAAKYQKNFFFNDASPPYAILVEGGNEQTVKQVKTGFVQKLAGWMHSREPVVLTGKGISIEKLGTTMVEVDMIETRRFLRDQTLQHYQIPPEIYGIIENSNRSTIDSAFYLFNKNVISGDLRFFERVITAQLCVEYDTDLCYRHDEIIQEDEEFALKVYSAGLANGTITRNEWRTRMRLPEVKGGDVFMMPFSTMVVPLNGDIPAPEPKPEPVVIPTDTVLEIEDEKTYLKIADNPEVEIRKKAIWQAFDRKAVSVEEPFIRAVKKISSVQSGKVKDAVKAAVRLAQTEKSITAALDSQFNAATDKAVKSTLAPAWKLSLEAGRAHALDTLGTGGKAWTAKANDAIVNEWFNKWIDKQGLKKAKEINTTTYDSLRKKLIEEMSASISDGDGLAAMTSRIMEVCDGVYDTMDKSRATLIARTESASTVNAGTYAVYDIEGVKQIEWLSVRDDRTREAHVDVDGQTVKIGDKFDVGGDMMEYPGDPSASAGNLCNCRCTIAGVFE